MSSRKRKSEKLADEDKPSKKGKTIIERPERQEDDEGNPYWEISSKKRIAIQEWKGTILLSIREYYQKDGKTLPGKGISLTPEQVGAMIMALPEVFPTLQQMGVELPDPAGVPMENSDDEEENEDPEDKEEDEEEEEDDE